MKKILITLSVCSFLFGCATDPYTGESKVSKTAYGTGIGAAVGAGIGALVGGKDGALIGAGIGAAGGAATGGYMDLQARELRQQLVGSGVQVAQVNGNVQLIMPGNITFDFDDSNVKSSFKPTLDSIAKVLEKYNQTALQVIGHTDNVGSADYNQKLSLKRANTVASYLKLRGIAQNRISAYGAGANSPIADNKSEIGREQNRRVEIMLLNPQQ